MANPTQLDAVRAENRDQTLLAVADRAQSPRFPYDADGEGIPFVLLDGKVVSLEHLCDRPHRIRHALDFHTAGSFISYCQAHSDLDAIALWYSHKDNAFEATLDYHDANGASWCTHRASYELPKSPEWTIWMAANRKAMPQADFAEFIEANLPDIVEPSGAQLLEMVKTLQAKKAVQFESSVRLDNGAVHFRYSEDVRGSVTKGAIDIPGEITLGIAPYLGESPFSVQARLRWRISDNKTLVLWYELVREHKVTETVATEICERIAAALGVPVWRGVAPQ